MPVGLKRAPDLELEVQALREPLALSENQTVQECSAPLAPTLQHLSQHYFLGYWDIPNFLLRKLKI